MFGGYAEEDLAPAPSLAEVHNQWHAAFGWDATCPLDCGATEVWNEELD